MQKWLPGIVATLLLPTCVLGAGTLYDTYLQSTGRFPTLVERAKSALECGIVSTAAQYTGSQKQNTLLNTCLTASGAFAGLVTRPNSYSPGTIIRSSQVNSDLDTLYTLVNGNIDNANIKSGAAITPSKIDGTAIVSSPSGAQTITNTTTFYATTFVSTTAGFFAVPRMTTVQRDALYGLENGAMVYNTTVGEFQVREGGAWAGVTAAAVSAVSSLTAKGVSELATGTEAASSTPAGSGDTNAPLVLHAGISTSSPYIAGKYVPITKNNGKLDQTFLDLTDSFTFTSTTFFTAPFTVTATSTMATSTVASSTISTLNASQIWLNNKNANTLVGGSTSNADALHTHDKLYSFVSSTATAITYANSTTETQLASSTIPAGSLNTRGFAIMNLHVSDYDTSADSDGILTLRVYYGSTAIASCAIDNNGGVIGAISNMTGDLQVIVMNNGSTASQAGEIMGKFESSNNTNKIYDGTRDAGGGNCDGTGTATIDSTVPQPFRVTGDWGGTDPLTSITISHTITYVIPER